MTSVRLSSLLLIATLFAAAPALADKPQKPPREPLSVTTSTYSILQKGNEQGEEKIVVTVFNDNTVSIDAANRFSPTAAVKMTEEIKLLLREESYFPLSYDMDKTIEQGEHTMKYLVDINMYANVAEITTKTEHQSGTKRITVPTGTAFLETGVVYIYHQFIHAYDRDRGGPQRFNGMEVTTARQEQVSVELEKTETITVGDAEYETDVFRISREMFDIIVYVDHDGRIVRVEQNFMNFDLVEWSSE